MRYIQSYATQANQFPDKLPDCPKGAPFMDCFKINLEQNSAFIVLSAFQLLTGPWFGFQKKGIWKTLWYGGGVLNILTSLWAASQTGWHFYLFGNKVI